MLGKSTYLNNQDVFINPPYYYLMSLMKSEFNGFAENFEIIQMNAMIKILDLFETTCNLNQDHLKWHSHNAHDIELLYKFVNEFLVNHKHNIYLILKDTIDHSKANFPNSGIDFCLLKPKGN